MTFSKDLKPKGEGGTLYTSKDLSAIQAEINALKAATAQLENQLAGMADLTNTTVLRANAVQTHDLSANLAVLGTAVVEDELAVSNGSGQDKDVIVNRNGIPEWGTPTDINAVNVLVTDTVERATTVDHTGTVNEAESVSNVDQCETVGEAQTVTQANSVTHADVVTEVDTIAQVDSVTNANSVTNAQAVTNADNVSQADKVAHADLVQVADVIQQTGDAQIVGNLDVTGSITQDGYTLDNTYIKLTEKGAANGVAMLDNTGRVPASQLTIDAMEYKGKWDADTNTPTLADGSGTDGDFYIVSVAGSQDLGSGNIDFYVNDRVLYNGSEWERIPAGQVDSVNGATGDVVLTGEDIAESTSDNLKIDRRLKNWLYVDGQGANATKTARGYFSADGIALITFDVNNVYQDAFSLTINGMTCQVYLNGAPTSSTNYTMPKGTYIVKTGILGLTPYYVIDTEYCVFSAREANHAQTADSATTATRATSSTTAQYSRIANNQYYQSTTAAATQAKTLTETISGTIQAGTSIALRFTNANTATAPYLTIGSSTFNIYMFGERLTGSTSWTANKVYRATIVSFSGDYDSRGKIVIEPIEGKTLKAPVTFSPGTSEATAYTVPRDGFFAITVSTNDVGYINFKCKRNGAELSQDGWYFNTHTTGGLKNTLTWVPVFANDELWVDNYANISTVAYQFYGYTER